MLDDLRIGDALAQMNVVREAFGYDPLYELPSAKRGDVASCLFYRGLKDVGCQGVGSKTIEFSSERQAAAVAELWGTTSEGRSVNSPMQMARTIGDFDGKRLGHYDLEHREVME